MLQAPPQDFLTDVARQGLGLLLQQLPGVGSLLGDLGADGVQGTGCLLAGLFQKGRFLGLGRLEGLGATAGGLGLGLVQTGLVEARAEKQRRVSFGL